MGKNAMLAPIVIGQDDEELSLQMTQYVKKLIKHWGLFTEISIPDQTPRTIKDAVNLAQTSDDDYVIWIGCPAMMPPGQGPEEPGEIKLTFRIIQVPSARTLWYLEEKVTWYDDANAWVTPLNGELAPAVKTILSMVFNDLQPNKKSTKKTSWLDFNHIWICRYLPDL